MISVILSAELQKHFRFKPLLLCAGFALLIASLLLPFASRPDRYWPIVFPAFVLGTSGSAAFFAHANIAIYLETPPVLAGTIGAIFNSALQLGSSVGNAVIKAIETNVNDKHGGDA